MVALLPASAIGKLFTVKVTVVAGPSQLLAVSATYTVVTPAPALLKPNSTFVGLLSSAVTIEVVNAASLYQVYVPAAAILTAPNPSPTHTVCV